MLVEITGGEQEPLDVVKSIVEKQRLNHPVLWDKNCRNHKNYGLTNWPVAYLIDTHGHVFWEGNPARVVNRPRASAELKQLIEEKLRGGRTRRKAAVQPEMDSTVSPLKRTTLIVITAAVCMAVIFVFGFLRTRRTKDSARAE